MKEKIFIKAPHFFQNLMVTLYNLRANRVRYRGKYKFYRQQFLKNRNLQREELLQIQRTRFKKFVYHALNNSTYYKNLYDQLPDPTDIRNIRNLPIIRKEDLRNNLKSIVPDNLSKLEKSKTGGTTGKSLEVYYTYENMQERFAMLDDFRSRFGYELGKKTAWFSGKALLNNKDIRSNRFWKTDFYFNVRYYSTFHIKEEYLKFYLQNLIHYRPEFFIGFPSTILEIAKYGLKNNYDYPSNSVKAIFPTAETVTPHMRDSIETFFKTKMYNQYASSEGAPFIMECEQGNLHLELQSGVFEVLDEYNMPSSQGKLVVTSFTTYGTPLIRYDIGDSIILDDSKKICSCGNSNPMVKEILGRKDDYIYSPKNGKINLGNISNTLKDTKGITKFKVVQSDLNCIHLYIIIDNNVYNQEIEKIFIKNWRDRIGNDMVLDLNYVRDIPVEKSGKFRFVENNIKHLI